MLAATSSGTTDGLYFIDDLRAGTALADGEVEIQVKATGMNPRDIMVAMGVPAGSQIGIECSGVITSVGPNVGGLTIGDRVAALCDGAYSTYTRAKSTSTIKMTNNMSFECAAASLVSYCSAYYSLVHTAHLSKGETVLIHDAASGDGQAAILLSRMVGAEVFTTVRRLDDKQSIIDEFGLAVGHVFHIGNTSFASAILRATGGQGVDVVLSSSIGDMMCSTWDCLGHFGRFIDTEKPTRTLRTQE
jgi:NADPH:quinone reductase-like Zn-dependent oxidoreductase